MEHKTGKTLAWVYGTVITFAATYLVGGILLDKLWNKKEQERVRRDTTGMGGAR